MPHAQAVSTKESIPSLQCRGRNLRKGMTEIANPRHHICLATNSPKKPKLLFNDGKFHRKVVELECLHLPRSSLNPPHPDSEHYSYLESFLIFILPVWIASFRRLRRRPFFFFFVFSVIFSFVPCTMILTASRSIVRCSCTVTGFAVILA
jgi:hypothetical protein